MWDPAQDKQDDPAARDLDHGADVDNEASLKSEVAAMKYLTSIDDEQALKILKQKGN